MIEVTLVLPIGTAVRLSDWLESQRCDSQAAAVLDAIEKQGLPQVDAAIGHLTRALEETQ